jgi:putative metalloenzyme radical SAM/SPASM domain maturase
MKNDEASSAAVALLPPQSAFPRKLFVETTTRCNMGCIMCVKQSPGVDNSDGEISPDLFSALGPAFPHLEALVLNGIGEPLLHPQLEMFIRSAKVSMPADGWVGFQSNGVLLSERRAISLVEAGLDKICISVDAASADKYSNLRQGGELPAIVSAFAALSAASKECNRPGLQVGMEFVLMRGNMRELPATLRWAAGHGASFAIVTHLLPYDEPHLEEAAYETCGEESVALFNRFKKEAESLGVDLCGYFEARWKFVRNPREEKIVALVESMKSEADRRGIFIDMKKLLRIKSERLEEVAALFAVARAVAEETGLELRLPEVTLSEKRRCMFVEEGSAFVSWQGNVSPCYFLWHRYLCFASGWSQQVQPKVFGNLKERGILEIWNDPAFRLFRENVLAYDYPVCSSCTLAPCDYVQTEEFEQDCHIGNVPCGACLWCMGMFQCLR